MRPCGGLVSAALLVAPVAAAEPEVPPRLGMLVLLKVLTYDAGFEKHGTGDFVVSVPFSPGREEAAQALLQELAALEIKTIKQRPLLFERVSVAEKKAAHAVLVSSALDDEGRRQVIERCRQARQYSLALAEGAVREGVLLGVAPVGARLQPVLNATTARASGVEFSTSVLKLVRVVQSP